VFKRITRSAATLLAGMLAALLVAGAAAAAPPVPFSLVDEVDFAPGGAFTFTATSPLCAAGTVVDDIKVEAFARSERARSGGGNVLILSTLTCADGSGTFQMRKHIQLTFTASGFTTAGPFQIFGGTGDYAGISGHGFTTGEVVGVPGTGGGAFTGVVKLP
jgi:hypothetical protein